MEHDRQVSVLIVKNFILVIMDGLDLWEFHFSDGQDRLRSSTSTTSRSVSHTITVNDVQPGALEQEGTENTKQMAHVQTSDL